MCGILGFIDPKLKIDAGTKRMLAWLNQSRGTDGHGFVIGNKGERLWGFKDGQSIVDAMKGVERSKRFEKLNSQLVLGHTRRASTSIKGSASSTNNSHPFQVGNIILAHNGFISNHAEIAAELKQFDEYKEIAETYQVDSNIAAAAVSKWGFDALGRIQGKASMWWINSESPTTIYAWCWDQDFAFFEGDECFVFSSDVEHLKACGFHGAKVLAKDTGQLLEIDLPTGTYKKIANKAGKPFFTLQNNYSNNDYIDSYPLNCNTQSEIIGFGAMNGHFVGWCPKCNGYNAWWDSYMKTNDKGNKRLHCMDCGSIMYPVKDDDRKKIIAQTVKESTKEEIDKLCDWFTTTKGNSRQLSVRAIMADMHKYGSDYLCAWEFATEEECDASYDDDKKASSHAAEKAVEGLPKNVRKKMKHRTHLDKLGEEYKDDTDNVVEADFDKMEEEHWARVVSGIQQ